MAVLEITARRTFAFHKWRDIWQRSFSGMDDMRRDLIEVHVLTQSGLFCRDDDCYRCKTLKSRILWDFIEWWHGGPQPIEPVFVGYAEAEWMFVDYMQIVATSNSARGAIYLYVNGQRYVPEPGLPLPYFVFYAILDAIHHDPEIWPYVVHVPGRALPRAARSPPSDPRPHAKKAPREGSLLHEDTMPSTVVSRG